MNISNSYSAPGILQPSFSSSQPHTHTQSEITTTHTNNKYTGNNIEIKSDHLERVKKSQVILEKYPDRVPVIIQPSKTDRDLYPIDKSKYITPRDLTLMQLQQIIRKRIRFPPEKALFMFVNNKLYPITSLVGTIYDENKESDGFLYVTYCQENTFGSFS
jgi:GABA(A) receptor-associated protein